MFLHVRVTLQGWIAAPSSHELLLRCKLVELSLSHLHLLMHILTCTLYANALVEFHTSTSHHLCTHRETRLMCSDILDVAAMLALYAHLHMTWPTNSLLIIHDLLLANHAT